MKRGEKKKETSHYQQIKHIQAEVVNGQLQLQLNIEQKRSNVLFLALSASPTEAAAALPNFHA